MASTNKTTHYNLSQYIGSDKPTYLVDYNTDMSNIDTGIYNAKSEAENNTTNIGTLSNLETSSKTDLVSAINEVKGETNNIGNLSNLTTSANTNLVVAINEVDAEADLNNQNIGTMTNLETTVKTSLVGAINEINTKAETNKTSIGTLSDLNTTDKSSLVEALNEVLYNLGLFNLTTFETISNSNISTSSGTLDTSNTSLNIAKNSNGSLAKIYGRIMIIIPSSQADTNITISFPSSLRPSSNITINALGTWGQSYGGYNDYSDVCNITIATDGTVTINGKHNAGYTNINIILHPCLLFIKDFGDEPIPPAPIP